jgi:hypothetical protein
MKNVKKPKPVRGAIPSPVDSLFLAAGRDEFELTIFKTAQSFSVVRYWYSPAERRRVIDRLEFTDFAAACLEAAKPGDEGMVYAIGSGEAFGLGAMLPRAKWPLYLAVWRERCNL